MISQAKIHTKFVCANILDACLSSCQIKVVSLSRETKLNTVNMKTLDGLA